MARNGSGSYALPIAPYVSGTNIVAADMNSNLSDIAAALTQSVSKDGQTTMTGALSMGSQRITSLGTATAATDAINLTQTRAEAFNYATSGGSANAQTLALTPALTAQAAGTRVKFKAGFTNTGATTMNIDSLGALAIQSAGAALTGGEIVVNGIYELVHDGTQYQLTGASGASKAGVQANTYSYATSGGAANAYTLTVTPAIAAYAAGQEFEFLANFANTGATTIAVSGLAAKAIQKQGAALSGGEIPINTIVKIVYDGTQFQLISPNVLGADNKWCGTSGGSANAQTLTPTPALAAYAAGQRLTFVAGFGNTGATTINVSGLGTKSVFFGGFSLTGGEIVSNRLYEIVYDGTNYQIVGTCLFGDGIVASPGIAFGQDTDTGLHRSGANTMAIVTGGFARRTISTADETATLVQLGPAGAVGAPTYSFSGDPNTGFYSVGADSLGISTGGVVRRTISTASETATLVQLGPNGSASAPAYSFSADADGGFYRVSNQDNAISHNGVVVTSFGGGGTTRQVTICGELLDNPGGVLGVRGGQDGTMPAIYSEYTSTIQANKITSTHATYASTILEMTATRAGNSAFKFASFLSNAGADPEFNFSGDGNGTCDGSWTGGGADYAEYFEVADPGYMLSRMPGVTVSMIDGKVQPAKPGDTIVGVTRPKGPGRIGAIIGNNPLNWHGKYEVDDFGRYTMETVDTVTWEEIIVLPPTGDDGTEKTAKKQHSYEIDKVPEGVVVPADAKREPIERRKASGKFDPKREYRQRSERDEWALIGLVGQVPVLKGQPVDPRWIKMREISPEVDLWLLR